MPRYTFNIDESDYGIVDTHGIDDALSLWHHGIIGMGSEGSTSAESIWIQAQ